MRWGNTGTTLVVAAGQITASGLGLLALMILARRVDIGELGTYFYLLAIASAMEGLTDAGLRLRGLALLSSVGDPFRATDAMDLLWKMKAALSAITAAIILGAAALGWLGDVDRVLAASVAAVCVTLPSSNPVVWQLRAARFQWIESLGLVAYRLALIAVAAVPVAAALDADLLLAGMLVANVLFMFGMLVARSGVAKGDERLTAKHLPGWRYLISESWPLGVSLLAGQLAPRVWVIWIGLSALSTTVAEFSVSMTLIQTVLMAGAVLSATYLPLISRLCLESPQSARALAAALLQAGILLGTLFAILVALAAHSISIVVFGPKLAASGDFMLILSMAAPMVLTSFLGRVLLAAKAQGRTDLLAVVCGVAVGAVVGVATHGELGAEGLALAYVCGEAVTVVLKVRVVMRSFSLKWRNFAAVTRYAPVALLLAVWSGWQLSQRVSPGPEALAIAVLLVAALAVAIARGPGGGGAVLRCLAEA